MGLPGENPNPNPLKPMTGAQRAVQTIYESSRALVALWDPYDSAPADGWDQFVVRTDYQCKMLDGSLQLGMGSAVRSELAVPTKTYQSFRSIWPAKTPDAASFSRAKTQLTQFSTLLDNAWVAMLPVLYPAGPSGGGGNGGGAAQAPTSADLTWFQQLLELAKNFSQICAAGSFGPANQEGMSVATDIDTLLNTARTRLSDGGMQFVQLFPNTWRTCQNMRTAKNWSMAGRQAAPFLSQVAEAEEKVREAIG